MADIASLGIKVATQGAQQAKTELEGLAVAGGKAEQQTRKLAAADKELSESIRSSASIRSEASRRAREEVTKEASVREANWKVIRAQFAEEKQIASRRADAMAAFGPALAAQERVNAGLAREHGVRERLSKLLETSRGQRILEASATGIGATGMARFGLAMGAGAKSAKELQFATRGLPAQFTDIATSLASGQKPMLVFLQQGGQIKDIFGGVGPALRAMGSYVVGLINPLTLAAAAIVGIGVAWRESTSESEDFSKALILSGNRAKQTVGDLRDLAEEIGRTTNASSIGASDALAKVVATGRFTADQLGLVTKAAINMEQLSGQAIEETIKQFVGLQNDPVAAILKLNESQNFLTSSTIRQIEEFVRQGREADAASLAIKAWADTINTRAPQAEQSLSGFSQLLRSIKNDAADDAAAIVQMFSAAEQGLAGFAAQHEQLINRLKEASRFVPLFGGTFASLNVQKPTAHPARGAQFQDVVSGSDSVVDSRAERARIDAENDFASLVQSNLSKKAALEAEITKIKETGNKAGKSELEIARAIADARARYAESLPKGPKPKKISTAGIENAQDRFADMVGRFQSELDGPLKKAEVEHVRRMREIEQAAKKAKIGHDELAQALALEGQAYQKNADAIREGLQSQVADLSGPVAQVQDEHARRLREIAQLSDDLGLSAAQSGVMVKEEARAFEEASKAAERMADPMDAMLDDMQFELSLLSMTNAQRATAIQQRQLEAQGIKANTDALLAQNQAYEDQQKQIALLDEFRSEASDALSDFVTGAKSAKEALKDFFDSMAEAITKAIANKWMEQLFGQPGTSQTGSAGGVIAGIADMIFGGGWGGIAKGAAFPAGVTAFANGGVVDKATMFSSGGKLGVYGEAGPEAILPLHRGPDGMLGVRMAANDDGPRGHIVNNNTTFVLPNTYTPQTQAQVAQQTQRVQSKQTARNR